MMEPSTEHLGLMISPTQICDNCTTTDSIYVEILDVDIVQNDTTICLSDSLELSVVSNSNGSSVNLNNGLVATTHSMEMPMMKVAMEIMEL